MVAKSFLCLKGIKASGFWGKTGNKWKKKKFFGNCLFSCAWFVSYFDKSLIWCWSNKWPYTWPSLQMIEKTMVCNDRLPGWRKNAISQLHTTAFSVPDVFEGKKVPHLYWVFLVGARKLIKGRRVDHRWFCRDALWSPDLQSAAVILLASLRQQVHMGGGKPKHPSWGIPAF